MPELSIIMPVYNAEETLRYSIHSILNQTYQDFELILVNDGSTDGSCTICDKFANEDTRIHVIHKENEGAGAARNAGLKIAKGKYVTFPDADDLCKPHMYEIMMGVMKDYNVDLTICSYENVKIDNKGICSGHQPQKLLDYQTKTKQESRELWFQIRSENISQLNTPWNKIYKRDMIEKYDVIFPDLRRAQDAVFNLYYYNHVTSVCVINQCLYQYNINDVQKTGKKFPKDVYQCFIEYNRVMEEIISGWGLFTGSYKALCDNNLLGNIDNCICLCENPVWKLTTEQKTAYLSVMIKDEYLQSRIRNYSGNVTEIEDIIPAIIKYDPKGILQVLRKRRIMDILRNSIIGSCWRKFKVI